MSRQTRPAPNLAQRLQRKLGPGAFMFLATLMALPVNAGITLPTDPLTTSSRVPPNVLFILDDSGSMADTKMPDTLTSISTVNIASQTYTRNAIYYNPAVTYMPWTTAGGAPMTGGTSFNSVYGSRNFATGTMINLADSGSCGNYDNNGNGVDQWNDPQICGGVQTYYVPKDVANGAESYIGDARNYYRFQISSASQVTRSEYGAVAGGGGSVTPNGFPRNNINGGARSWNVWSFTVPSDAYAITVTTSGGSLSRNGADLYLRRNASPQDGTSGRLQSVTANTNQESITTTGVQSGTWYVGINADSNSSYTGVTLTVSYERNNRCGTGTGSNDWINCTGATPTGRTAEAEAINYATWYSYHRTRMKAAKAGASSAFRGITADMRVGFRTIWGSTRDPSNPAANAPTYAVPIPVGHNGGLFLDTPAADNRSKWYERLFATYALNGTPLHGALRNAGEYYKSRSADGPYGPGTGDEQLACRQNFSILTTDGYWNSSSNYTSDVGNADGTAGDRITGPNGASYQYSPAAPFSDTYGTVNLGPDGDEGTVDATLADVAMKYWKTDLTNMANIVPTTTANPAFWQHMVTFGIAIGLNGTADQNTVAEVMARGNASVGGTNGWPRPVGDRNTTIDDLLHASVNGHGTFVSASDPLAFTNGLKAALSAITERTGSFSNVAANTGTMTSDARLFQANYVSGVWTGDILSYTKRTTGTGFNTTADWRASEGIPTTGRKVLTSDAGVGAVFPTTAQVNALARNGTTDEYRVTGANNAAYIAGARNLEIQNGGVLRSRVHLLGDIVSSSPFYVKETNTVYVGANDGMLHAFNANTGAELFAFVPNGINLSDLSTLSRPDYSHRFFVDGQVVVSNRTQGGGENILVGTLGKGGKGLFALTVTTPGSVQANNVLRWEKLETLNNNMGLIQSRPLIVKLNNNQTGLIVPNGVNSTNGRAVLLVYNLSTGTLLAELDTGVGDPGTDAANTNGLTGAVGWDRDGNGTTDYVYGGDLLGNMWKFDLSSATTSNWAVGNGRAALFTAMDGTTRQPITGSPMVAMHPTTYKTWVFFGTGRFMTVGDVSSRAVQSLYAIIDANATVAKANLTQRQVVVATTSDGKRVRAFQANAALPTGSSGWYMNLLDPSPAAAAGERIVTAPQMDGKVLEFSSIIPTSDACQADGRGYLNAIDAFTGTSSTLPYFDVNGDGNFNNDNVTLPSGGTTPTGSVDPNVGMVTQGALFSGSGGGGGGGQICAAGSSGSMGCLGKNEVRNVGRVSWREVIRN